MDVIAVGTLTVNCAVPRNPPDPHAVRARLDDVAAGGGQGEPALAAVVHGSAETLRRRIGETIRAGDLDGMMLMFPDFIEDQRFFGERVLQQQDADHAGRCCIRRRLHRFTALLHHAQAILE